MGTPNKYSVKISAAEFAFIFIVILVLSCTKKNESNCYICTTTYTMTTDVPVAGYPSTISYDDELCDITAELIAEYERTTKGSDTAVIEGVTYISRFWTVCRPK